MDKIQEKDFIEIEYTGRLKGEGFVFDTTDSKEAKKAGIFNEKIDYAPAIICVGESQLIGMLDKKLIGKEVSKEYKIELVSEEAFGNKDSKLLKLIPVSVFKKQKIKALMKLELGIKPEHISLKNGEISVDSKIEIPDEFADMLKQRFSEMIPSVKSIKFAFKNKETSKANLGNKNV